MGQKVRRLNQPEGKVSLLQDVFPFPFKAFKDEKLRVTTKKLGLTITKRQRVELYVYLELYTHTLCEYRQ